MTHSFVFVFCFQFDRGEIVIIGKILKAIEGGIKFNEKLAITIPENQSS